jgi:hypothetical protein
LLLGWVVQRKFVVKIAITNRAQLLCKQTNK